MCLSFFFSLYWLFSSCNQYIHFVWVLEARNWKRVWWKVLSSWKWVLCFYVYITLFYAFIFNLFYTLFSAFILYIYRFSLLTYCYMNVSKFVFAYFTFVLLLTRLIGNCFSLCLFFTFFFFHFEDGLLGGLSWFFFSFLSLYLEK